MAVFLLLAIDLYAQLQWLVLFSVAFICATSSSVITQPAVSLSSTKASMYVVQEQTQRGSHCLESANAAWVGNAGVPLES